MLALPILPHAVHGLQTVKLLMETADVVKIAMHSMIAVQMLAALEVNRVHRHV